jgi:formiminotetrahydrofolate cyclodeaminase
MAAALVEMGARRSPGWEDAVGVAAQARTIRRRIVPLVQADADAYAASLAALASIEDASGSGRDEAIESALTGAADVALAIARAGTDTAFLAELVADRGEPSGRDDAQAAAVLAEAGTRVAAALVAANLVTAEGDDRETAAASCARSAALVRSRMGE